MVFTILILFRMHHQFYGRNTILTENMNKVNKGSKRSKQELNSLIRSLILRREKHEAVIQKLVSPSYLSRDVTKESLRQNQSEFEHILSQLDENEQILITQGQESVGAFGSHVNLLATVSLKTDYHLCEKASVKEIGQLSTSLQSGGLKTCNIVNQLDSSHVPVGISEALRQTADYLSEEDLAEGLFTTKNDKSHSLADEYYGTRFSLGKYEEIHLSKHPITQKQRLAILYEGEDEDEVGGDLNVGWLLLKRLLSETNSKCFPYALHTLFSYPIKTFNIRDSLELIEFNELLGQLSKNESEDESSLVVYGIDEKNSGSYSISNLSKSKSLKYYRPILNRFSKLMVVHHEELPVKHIPLSCLQGHFVVVTSAIACKGEYFLSVGSSASHKRYRVYVLDNEGNIVYGEVVRNGEFIHCRLNQEEYEIYVSPVFDHERESREKGLEESFELVRDHQEHFNLWVQGKQVHSKNGELGLEIRLKQEYNHYTKRIAENYLKKGNLESEEVIDQASKFTIKRQIISSLNLVVDNFLFTGKGQMIVSYKEGHTLTDHLFQQTSASVASGQSLVLYSPSEIERVQIKGGDKSQQIDYKIVQSYI